MSIQIEPRPAKATRDPAGAARPGGPPPAAAQPTPSPPPLPGRRNPKWIALGVVAICLGGLLSYLIYGRLATEVSVVAVARTVYRGATVAEADLRTVTITPARSVAYVPAAELRSLLGKRAAFDLAEGALLTPGAIADVKLPANGRAVVGVKLVPGRAPAGLLHAGSPVRLVALPTAAEGGVSGQTGPDEFKDRAYPGYVIDVQVSDDDGSSLVNVDVRADQANDVSTLAALNRLALVRDADR